jgi:hypothetical protein
MGILSLFIDFLGCDDCDGAGSSACGEGLHEALILISSRTSATDFDVDSNTHYDQTIPPVWLKMIFMGLATSSNNPPDLDYYIDWIVAESNLPPPVVGGSNPLNAGPVPLDCSMLQQNTQDYLDSLVSSPPSPECDDLLQSSITTSGDTLLDLLIWITNNC